MVLETLILLNSTSATTLGLSAFHDLETGRNFHNKSSPETSESGFLYNSQ